MSPAAKRSSYSWVAAAFVVLAGLSTNAGADVRDPMVALDRAYVPALALTNMPGKDAQSREATRRLSEAWAGFTKTIDPAFKRDRTLAKVLAESTEKITAAAALAGAGQIAKAHDALEHVRGALWKWREARGLVYFPDSLTAFHDEMEHLVDLGAKGADREAQRKAYASARSRWVDVERAAERFEAKLYGFDAARIERLRGLMAKERALLDDYAVALAASNPQALAGAGRALKGNFAQTYFLFGDFAGLQ